MQHVFYICHIQTLMSPSYNDYLNTNVLIRSYSFHLSEIESFRKIFCINNDVVSPFKISILKIFFL